VAEHARDPDELGGEDLDLERLAKSRRIAKVIAQILWAHERRAVHQRRAGDGRASRSQTNKRC
jgi:hypothetical protein